jgi:hypothetical protein
MATDEKPTDPGLVKILAKTLPGLEFPAILKGQYPKDNFFGEVLKNPKHYKDFYVKDGLVYFKRGDSDLLCVPNVVLDGHNVREILIRQGHSLLAHLATKKTLDYLREHVWWRDMVRDITDFCATCTVCAMSKPPTQKPMGLFRALEVP